MERLQIVLFNSTYCVWFYTLPENMKCEHFKKHEDGKNTVHFVITERLFLCMMITERILLYMYVCARACIYI